MVDADGLFGVSQDLGVVNGGGRHIALTPNIVEFNRIKHALSSRSAEEPHSFELDGMDQLQHHGLNEDLVRDLVWVCRELGGVNVLLKGPHDMISDGSSVIVSTGEQGWWSRT